MLKAQSFFILLLTIILLSTGSLAETANPGRETIAATIAKLEKHWSVDDMQSWVGLFAEDATFLNSALMEPVVGKEAIRQMASQWPKAENIQEWRIVEGNRMAVGWRERSRKKNGDMGAWYRGMSTFVFDTNGQIISYKGIFNLEAIRAAYTVK